MGQNHHRPPSPGIPGEGRGEGRIARRARWLVSAACALSIYITGCATSRPAIHPTPPRTTLVFLPGIAGSRPIDHGLIDTLIADGVVQDAIEIDWTLDRRPIDALQGSRVNHEQAKFAAAKLLALRAERPNDRIILAGHSGGTGVAVWTLEMLPAETPVVDDLLLLSPSLSPEYDLGPAFQRIRGRALSVGSPEDRYVLQMGTSFYGTFDGKLVPAAGFSGFASPPAKLEQLMVSREQLASPAWMAHFNPLYPAFVRARIEPWLRKSQSLRSS
ncbi:MAG: hypothetical protein QM770_06430 [Tepidisphaeraceae bacterium]